VERRLEMTEKENRTKINKEKEELISKRREKEQQILVLKRKKAIVQYASKLMNTKNVNLNATKFRPRRNRPTCDACNVSSMYSNKRVNR
jgi:predicted ATPase